MHFQHQITERLPRHVPTFALLAFTSLAMIGCTFISPPLPPALANVKLIAVSSPNVEVLTPRIRMVKGAPWLDGSLRRKIHGGSTERSILKVSCFDTAGTAVLVRLVAFTPAELRLHSLHTYNEGRYEMPLTGVSGAIGRIEVMAVTK